MPDKKILIVDDEEANIKLLISWLIPPGYDVDIAVMAGRRWRRPVPTDRT